MLVTYELLVPLSYRREKDTDIAFAQDAIDEYKVQLYVNLSKLFRQYVWFLNVYETLQAVVSLIDWLHGCFLTIKFCQLQCHLISKFFSSLWPFLLMTPLARNDLSPYWCTLVMFKHFESSLILSWILLFSINANIFNASTKVCNFGYWTCASPWLDLYGRILFLAYQYTVSHNIS